MAADGKDETSSGGRMISSFTALESIEEQMHFIILTHTFNISLLFDNRLLPFTIRPSLRATQIL